MGAPRSSPRPARPPLALGGVAVAVARRPALWPAALRQARRLLPRGWWRRWPPLPRPDPAYLRFRLQTMYGGAGEEPASVEDVVRWLEWTRRA